MSQPRVTVQVTAPADFMFSIIHDLMNKRARILGIHTAGADVQVTAAVSEAALIDYAGRLHAITAGQGSYTVTAEPSGE